ncbi:hypothetical protein CCO03_11730 [Comamonas serinivorans]|uniref:CheW-like domain-containing protein n=1 Tax=Comamonas serinivorans TaxID=1082851 RepID=A0A1Y0EP94_9BURK|nr:chemotaxis protein CheW [Comamonas serinivorans]ARU05260.1 hypothetical protein CCO03_11730 [Comamonas serinivorans]
MADKQALENLQNRLTDKLKVVEQVTQGASWLGVESHGRLLLLPLSHAGEIFPFEGAKRVPYVKPWFVGVANLRGALCGVVDIGGFVASDVPPNTGPQSRVVALNPLLQINAALLIDRLMGLKTRRDFVRSTSVGENLPDYFGHMYTDQAGKSWQEINLQKLALSEQFLSIAEAV